MRDKRLVRKLARDLAGVGAAHAVAEGDYNAVFRCAFFNDETVLIVLSDSSLIGDTEAFHTALPSVGRDRDVYFFSCIFRRSCPHEASTSPPSFRLTVTFTPLSSSIFMNAFM